ncbi:hypothetical protein CLF_110615 [Clonorchis sinensis]|uniref:Tetraspanin n=1 Tax=Clonorchis sinensis TaxID=79923 RepID=G7YKX9_CLOSI|nr:hypothetical protein CLF_110615 [Clonorchis sinensis]
MVDLQSAEAREIYQKVLRPLVSIIFVHLLLVIINGALLFLGMFCRARFLLHFAMVMMSLLFLAETICYIYYLVAWEQMEFDAMVDTISGLRKAYLGAISDNFQTFLLNFIQQNFQCCGIYSFTEWFNPSYKWTRKIVYGGKEYELRIPISCCPNVSADRVPNCALKCATEMPYEHGCANYFSKMKMFRITRLPEKYYVIPFICLHLGALLSFVLKTVYEIREQFDYETRPEVDIAGAENIPRTTMGCLK